MGLMQPEWIAEHKTQYDSAVATLKEGKNSWLRWGPVETLGLNSIDLLPEKSDTVTLALHWSTNRVSLILALTFICDGIQSISVVRGIFSSRS